MPEMSEDICVDIAVFLKAVLVDRKLRKQLVNMPEFVQMCRHVAPNIDVLLTMLGEQIAERSARHSRKQGTGVKGRRGEEACLTTTT